MKPRDDGSRKRVVVILDDILPTEMSASNIADAIKTLSSAFSVTIMTRAPDHCRRVFPDARILALPSLPVRGGAFAFYIECWFVLPFLRADLVYIPGVEHAPSVVMSLGRPILCYGNCHPMQFVLNTRRKGGRLSRLLSRIHGLGMSIGLRRCDMMLATSPQLAEVYKSLGVPSSRIREISLAVPLDLFDPRGRREEAEGGRVLEGVYHGTMSKERGLDIMIMGAKTLARQRRDFSITLVGATPEEEKSIRRILVGAGVEEVFRILSPVPHADIPSILWAADFGISLLEPNIYFAASPPVKVLEFLAAGLPVIANEIPTHSLYLEDRKNALLIQYDSESFANAVRALLDEPGLRERLSKNARMSASRFSSESVRRVLIESASELIRPRS